MKTKLKATREGFGAGIILAAKKNPAVVALTADLAGSIGLKEFKKVFPERFIEVGVAEQNLVTVASGLALAGKIPFATSFAAFSPGRNFEQIRTTICYNNQPVIIVGSHVGLGVGEDGATHQMLEDISLMRSLPNMQVIVPCDFEQARVAVLEIIKKPKPTYLRVNRQKSPIITTSKTKFKIGKAQIMKTGKDITIISNGPMLYEAILATDELKKQKISAELINIHTIKPIDSTAIVKSAKKTKRVLTIEDHTIHGGLGSVVSEVLSQNNPTKMKIMGMNSFGESGTADELYKKYHLTAKDIVSEAKKLLKK